ncbi:uncharacterized protein G2W53_045221 [Senna tora]|uniref:Uncharacterized protein n=1 Tax=Senna tora TaxID=362788 RepID=A0A834SBT5_9FABA|nr:uncharacterized protein G2W53_045221 [Senna tora]
MLRHDPRSSHAMTTPFGPSNLFWHMLRQDPRSFLPKTTPIGASNPLPFANTKRTDMFHLLAQQVFCLVIRERFMRSDPDFRPEYVKT